MPLRSCKVKVGTDAFIIEVLLCFLVEFSTFFKVFIKYCSLTNRL